MKVGKLPENMEAIDDSAMKYSFKDNYAKGGFSFHSLEVGKDSILKRCTQKLRKKEIKW